MLDINSLFVILFANIFSNSVSCLSVFFNEKGGDFLKKASIHLFIHLFAKKGEYIEHSCVSKPRIEKKL